MESFAPLIWIEADRKPAKYFLNSLKIHEELYPSRRKIVVTNSQFIKSYRNYEVEIFEIEKLEMSNQSKLFDSINKNWNEKRQQLTYWKNTTKRFFYLYDLLLKLNLQKCLHLESDCILLDSDYVDIQLRNSIPKLIYTKQSLSIGCASIFLVNQRKSIKNFLDFINLNWNQIGITDMELLGKFKEIGQYAEFFPSWLDSKETDYIFDSATIGGYFLGYDARNFRYPFAKRGLFYMAEESFNPKYFRITLNQSQKITLENLISKSSPVLANIHIHSKRIPKNYNGLKNRLIKESNVQRNGFWRLGVLDRLVATERLISYLKRKVKIKSYEVRYR